MKSIIAITLFTLTTVLYSCSSGQSQTGNTALSATEFAQKTKELSSAKIIDVRTPDEFSKGHIQMQRILIGMEMNLRNKSQRWINQNLFLCIV